MYNRLEIYRSIDGMTEGDVSHLRQHLASLRPMLLARFSQLDTVPPIFQGLYKAALVGTHGELVLAMRSIHELIRGK